MEMSSLVFAVYSFPKQICHNNESRFTDTRLMSMCFFWLKFRSLCLCWSICAGSTVILLVSSLYENITTNLAYEKLCLRYVFAGVVVEERDRPLLAAVRLENPLVCKHNCTTKILFFCVLISVWWSCMTILFDCANCFVVWSFFSNFCAVSVKSLILLIQHEI